jgi:hypothetical protein
LGAILTGRQHGSGISAYALRWHAPIHHQGHFRITKGERSSRIGAGWIDCGVDGAGHGGRPVGEPPPSFLATLPGSVGGGASLHKRAQQSCRTLASRLCGGARFWELVGAVGC